MMYFLYRARQNSPFHVAIYMFVNILRFQIIMSLKNKILAVSFLMFGIISFAPTNANAGFWEFFFPTVDNKPKPSETLRAPFANEDAVIEDLDAKGNPQKQIPLHLRHRPNKIITQWVKNTVPLLLTYKADKYEQEYAKKVVNFNKVGLDEYVNFLHRKNIIKSLKTGKYNVTGIVQGYPVIINEGAVDGRYRWVYKMDLLITYFDRGLKKYDKVKDGDTLTQEYSLTIQVGRHKGVDNEHSVLIETWSVKDKKS